MKKKTVLVKTSKVGKTWSIEVTSTSVDLYENLTSVIHVTAGSYNLQILNATDPFAISKRKRKIHKPVMGPATNSQGALKS